LKNWRKPVSPSTEHCWVLTAAGGWKPASGLGRKAATAGNGTYRIFGGQRDIQDIRRATGHTGYSGNGTYRIFEPNVARLMKAKNAFHEEGKNPKVAWR
jgi:hypothetical protein